MTPIENVLARFDASDVRPAGQRKWDARCKAHEDRRASLSISEGEDGTVLLHCHAGCTPQAVVETLGLTLGDLFHKANGKPQIVATYDYRDADGALLMQVCRMIPKDFRQRKPDGSGGWSWSVKGVKRVPYRLPELLAADAKRFVLIAEGEKDVDRLAKLGFVATCNAGGAGKFHADLVPHFAGRNVVILPDADEPGRKHAADVAKKLRGTAASVRVVALPGLPHKGDVSDWIASGGTAADLKTIISSTPEYIPTAATPPASGNVRRLTMRQAVQERLGQYGRGPIPKVELGIGKLDKLLGGGIAYGSFAVVGALSSHGKTAFALQCSHWITGAQKIRTAFVSVEMSVDELADRTISFASPEPKENWHQLLERLEMDTKDHFTDAADCVLIEGVQSLAEIENEIVAEFDAGARVAIVDYAQLIDAGSRDDTNATMRRVSATFKRLAKEHNAVILCLAQLNKRVEAKKPMVPGLFDIEYGSKLAHDADVVLFLVWPHKIDQTKPPNEYTIFLEKNRNGQSKKAVRCRFNPPRQTIKEDDRAGQQEQEPPRRNGKPKRHDFGVFGGDEPERKDLA